MRLQLQKELCIAHKGCVFNIIPFDVKRKADKYLLEILQVEDVEKQIITVYDYYQKVLKNEKFIKKSKSKSALFGVQQTTKTRFLHRTSA